MSVQKSNDDDRRRNFIAQFLYKTSLPSGRACYGKIREAAIKWGVSRTTAKRIWEDSNKQLQEGLPIHLSNGKTGNKRKRLVMNFSMEIVLAIEPTKRKTIRSLTISLNNKGFIIRKTTVAKLVKRGDFKAHTNSIKSDFLAINQLLRLKWSLKALYLDHQLNQVKFKIMNSTIHIDEKWFYMTQAISRYYLFQGEEPVYRSCKSKSHITKVMFVCAVGRPWYATSGELILYGKIGLFPLTIQVPAQRNSKNRRAGTIETKIIEVTRAVYKNC